MTRYFLGTSPRVTIMWAIGAFVTLQIALAASVEIGLIDPRNTNTYAYRARHLRRRLDKQPSRPYTLVMFGSSRVMYGFKGSLLDEPLGQAVGKQAVAYNFGIAGGGHIYSYHALKQLLPEGIRPDLAIVEVLPFVLSQNNHCERQWFDAAGTRREIVSHPWWERWLVPWYTHRFFLVYSAAPKFVPRELYVNWLQRTDNSGWFAHPQGPQTAKTVQRTRRLLGPAFQSFRLGGGSCRALRDTLELCRQKQIRVALIFLPEASEMRSWYSSAMRSQVDEFIAKLGRDYAVPVIDGRAWLADDCFADASHLTVLGAERFTQRLGRLAIDAGIVPPKDWPDPLRKHDKGRPDMGAVPFAAPRFDVGAR